MSAASISPSPSLSTPSEHSILATFPLDELEDELDEELDEELDCTDEELDDTLEDDDDTELETEELDTDELCELEDELPAWKFVLAEIVVRRTLSPFALRSRIKA